MRRTWLHACGNGSARQGGTSREQCSKAGGRVFVVLVGGISCGWVGRCVKAVTEISSHRLSTPIRSILVFIQWIVTPVTVS
jgi:hypothetical protein